MQTRCQRSLLLLLLLSLLSAWRFGGLGSPDSICLKDEEASQGGTILRNRCRRPRAQPWRGERKHRARVPPLLPHGCILEVQSFAYTSGTLGRQSTPGVTWSRWPGLRQPQEAMSEGLPGGPDPERRRMTGTQGPLESSRSPLSWGGVFFRLQQAEQNHGNTARLLDPNSVSPDFVEWKTFLFFLTGRGGAVNWEIQCELP